MLMILWEDSPHNYLRISRILKCLSELGFERFNAAFVLHILQEQSERNELNNTGIRSSMDKWCVRHLLLATLSTLQHISTYLVLPVRWANCIRNEQERAFVGNVIKAVRSKQHVFQRETYRRVLVCRQEFGEMRWDVRPTQHLVLMHGEVDEPEERFEVV